MEDYKRVTIKNEENGRWGIDGKLVNQNQKPLNVFEEAFYIAVTRLAELEDKIENGTLIEVLLKTGDKIYQFDNGGKIYENEIKGFYYVNNTLIYDCGYFSFDKRALGKSIFLTKAEAEERLKGIQSNE